MILFRRLGTATEPNNDDTPDEELIYVRNDKGELVLMEDKDNERLEAR